jgi:hypothetical protein
VRRVATTLCAGATLGAALLLFVVSPSTTVAQSEAQKPVASPSPSPAAPTSAPTAQKSHKPNVQVPLDQALLLVRTTLLTLNDANRSGNYTVLRDLASPTFQARNTAADLGIVFAEMRKNNLTLLGLLLLSPQLTSTPEVDGDGRLRLSGYVPIRPQQITFDLMFEQSAGLWKLLNISISTPQDQTSTSAQQQPKPAPPHVTESRSQPAKHAAAPKPASPKLPSPSRTVSPPAQAEDDAAHH